MSHNQRRRPSSSTSNIMIIISGSTLPLSVIIIDTRGVSPNTPLPLSGVAGWLAGGDDRASLFFAIWQQIFFSTGWWCWSDNKRLVIIIIVIIGTRHLIKSSTYRRSWLWCCLLIDREPSSCLMSWHWPPLWLPPAEGFIISQRVEGDIYCSQTDFFCSMLQTCLQVARFWKICKSQNNATAVRVSLWRFITLQHTKCFIGHSVCVKAYWLISYQIKHVTPSWRYVLDHSTEMTATNQSGFIPQITLIKNQQYS